MEYKTVHPLYLAQLSRSSYLLTNARKTMKPERKVVRSKRHTSIIQTFGDRRIIATSGSRDFEHVWMNMDLRTIPLNDTTRFHRGFYRGAEELWNELEKEVDQTEDPLLFTGHSMGGAISVALAHFVQNASPSRHVHVVTFGSPRYASSEKALKPTFPIDNFVLEYDLVIKLPQYMRHMGKLRTIPTSDLPNPYHPRGIVRYHSIEHYIDKLKRTPTPWM